jgi:selenocysteine-specific elongation factor
MQVPLPAHLGDAPFDSLQFTLVDCPGHASLIRTIIGGAQIIDLMLLVIDVTKGIQTQTAECLVIGELLTQKLIVVLNKTDKFPEDVRSAKVEKMKSKLRSVFAKTKFGADVPMVCTAANPGGTEAADAPSNPDIKQLLESLNEHAFLPSRSDGGEFYFAIDHCFRIGGQGTVMTGTVQSGSISVGDTVSLPHQGLERKIKSIQVFRKPVQCIRQGDRAAIRVSNLEPSLMERGIACSENAVSSHSTCIISVDPIRFFKETCKTGQKFHVTVGHSTVMATVVYFFGASVSGGVAAASDTKSQEQLPGIDFSIDFAFQDEMVPACPQYALLEFEKSVLCPPDALLIASRLDTDIRRNSCRLAFSGKILQEFDMDDVKQREQLRIYKIKEKVGSVDRVSIFVV